MKEKLTINTSTVIEKYNNVDGNGKKALESLFGVEMFSNNISKIKTFQDALKVVGKISKEAKTLSEYKGKDKYLVAACAFTQLTIIAKALNQGWEPDWSNSDQNKYFPYFIHKSGVGLSFYDFDGWFTHTAVGSRLCFKSSELAEYAGKQFESIYLEFLTL